MVGTITPLSCSSLPPIKNISIVATLPKAAQEARLAAERKANKFRARDMPDFTKVWTPSKDDKWEPTKPKEFSLETDKRYGKLDGKKEDRSGAYVLSPDSAYDPLQLHLRQPARPKSAAA